MYPYLILKTIHIMSTAVWFGAGLPIARDVRRTIEQGRPHTDLLVERVTRQGRLAAIFGLLTLVSGLCLIFIMGGFGNVRKGIHAGFGLTLLSFAVGLALSMPTWQKIATSLRQEDGAMDEARRLSKRFAMFTGIEHLLWVVVLVVMVFRF